MAVQALEFTRTPQQILRGWVRETLLGRKEIQFDVALAQARNRFAGDKEFADALLLSSLPDLLKEALQQEVHRARPGGKTRRRVGSSIMSVEALEESIRTKLDDWYENTAPGVSKQILDLRRKELRAASGARAERIAGDQRAIAFMHDLATGMTNDRQTVESRYSDTELSELYAKHYGGE